MNPNPVCILGHEINKELKGCMSMSIGTKKRFQIKKDNRNLAQC
jgi:hypothetical protein